jgi:TolB protein
VSRAGIVTTVRSVLVTLVALVALPGLAQARQLTFTAEARRFLPGVVSAKSLEVKLTFSPDGRRLLWGAVQREGGPGDSDIWESRLEDGSWTTPAPVPFDTPAAEFDPFFAPDGRGVYYFSSRPGGLGGVDVWLAPFDTQTGAWGQPQHLGPNVNSSGDEWAPILSRDGRQLFFASDGRGGQGLHDLFRSELRDGEWQLAQPLAGGVNTPSEDFDAVLLENDTVLVFTRMEQGATASYLHVSFLEDGRWSEARRLGAEVNVEGVMNFGPCFNPAEPGVLYFTSKRDGDAGGAGDIYRIPYRLER